MSCIRNFLNKFFYYIRIKIRKAGDKAKEFVWLKAFISGTVASNLILCLLTLLTNTLSYHC